MRDGRAAGFPRQVVQIAGHAVDRRLARRNYAAHVTGAGILRGGQQSLRPCRGAAASIRHRNVLCRLGNLQIGIRRIHGVAEAGRLRADHLENGLPRQHRLRAPLRRCALRRRVFELPFDRTSQLTLRRVHLLVQQARRTRILVV
jgi:hypothetical protein